MVFDFEERSSDSPYVEVVWRNNSQSGGDFISMASSHWEMVITRFEGKTKLTLRGPETKATPAVCPPGASHFGIYFRHGIVMPDLMVSDLRDGMIDLPEAGSNSFWFLGASWQFPNYENADTFVNRLARNGLLARDPVVDTALRAQPPVLSVRSVQRRFLKTTGLTRGALDQINRARYATRLLQQGVSILETVDRAGYSDQPHLTRSLKHFIGLTPAQLCQESQAARLSFLSKFRPTSAS